MQISSLPNIQNVVGRSQAFFSTNSLTEEASANGRMCSLLLDETAEQFKESVRQFAQENIAPHAAKVDASNSFPKAGSCTFSFSPSVCCHNLFPSSHKWMFCEKAIINVKMQRLSNIAK
jgi:alkylation response protein AidB-like acyl-CoA dehydrogenase